MEEKRKYREMQNRPDKKETHLENYGVSGKAGHPAVSSFRSSVSPISWTTIAPYYSLSSAVQGDQMMIRIKMMVIKGIANEEDYCITSIYIAYSMLTVE